MIALSLQSLVNSQLGTVNSALSPSAPLAMICPPQPVLLSLSTGATAHQVRGEWRECPGSEARHHRFKASSKVSVLSQSSGKFCFILCNVPVPMNEKENNIKLTLKNNS